MYLIIDRRLHGLSQRFPLNSCAAIDFKLIKRLVKKNTVTLSVHNDVEKLESQLNKNIIDIIDMYKPVKVCNKHYIVLSKRR